MTASVGSWIFGSGTSSTRTSRLPCHVTAFIARAPSVAVRVGSAFTPGTPGLPSPNPAVFSAEQRIICPVPCAVSDSFRYGTKSFKKRTINDKGWVDGWPGCEEEHAGGGAPHC
ncbi:hypothetical protein GCM10023177_55380 [Streptomyces violaceoruber]|nr:hypothetical protein JCM4020_68490 [Streptomyces coelicolor]